MGGTPNCAAECQGTDGKGNQCGGAAAQDRNHHLDGDWWIVVGWPPEECQGPSAAGRRVESAQVDPSSRWSDTLLGWDTHSAGRLGPREARSGSAFSWPRSASAVSSGNCGPRWRKPRTSAVGAPWQAALVPTSTVSPSQVAWPRLLQGRPISCPKRLSLVCAGDPPATRSAPQCTPTPSGRRRAGWPPARSRSSTLTVRA